MCTINHLVALPHFIAHGNLLKGTAQHPVLLAEYVHNEIMISFINHIPYWLGIDNWAYRPHKHQITSMASRIREMQDVKDALVRIINKETEQSQLFKN